MTELIDWVESQAQENLRFRLSCLDGLLKECNTTLTILLAGVGATAAYAFKLFNSPAPVIWIVYGIIGLCIYFLILSALIIIKCMKIDEIQVPANEPDNLYQKEHSLLKIREAELKNIQDRINKAMTINLRIANWLNKIRLLILASPIIFMMASAFCL